MQDFPPNSAKARAQSVRPPQSGPEKIERITSAEAERRKPGIGKKFKETFIGGTARGAIDFTMEDIVIPAIRDLMFDAFQGLLDRVIYGEGRRGARRSRTVSSYSDVGHVNYQSVFSGNRPPTSSGGKMLSRRARARHDFDEIVISSRPEAQEVLDQMYEFLSRYGVVLVSELYEMTGIASSHTDHQWGWTSLSGAGLIRQRDGRFLLNLPEPQPLSA